MLFRQWRSSRAKLDTRIDISWFMVRTAFIVRWLRDSSAYRPSRVLIEGNGSRHKSCCFDPTPYLLVALGYFEVPVVQSAGGYAMRQKLGAGRVNSTFFDAVPLCRQRSANVGLVMQGYRGLILNALVPLVLKYYSLVLRVHSRSRIRGLELTCAPHDGRGSSSAPIPAHPIAEGHACG